MESNSNMRHSRPAPSTGRLMTVALFLAGITIAPAGCSGESDGAQDGADDLTTTEKSTPAESLKRGAQGPEVLNLFNYLRAYGYFPNPALRQYAGWEPAFAEEPADPRIFDEVLERALVLFQHTHGLPPDGLVNERTLQLMKTPRCGFPDVHGNAKLTGDPQSFTASGAKWPTRNLTYSFSSFTPDVPASTVQSAFGRAFTSWAAVAGLRFSQVSTGGDIAISFSQGDHGDGYPFDTAGGVLAHAFFPTNGDAHFDDAETWSDNGTGIDLETIALHEFGHSLGLDHSSSVSAVMYAYYGGARRALTSDDIQGIRSIYPNNVLMGNQGLVTGQSISSLDGRFSLVMQADGNLVHYWNGHGALWSTGTWGTQGKTASMQSDGNFVLYSTAVPTVGASLWSSNTYGNPGAYLAIQDDGNLVVYGSNGATPLWSSGTGGH